MTFTPSLHDSLEHSRTVGFIDDQNETSMIKGFESSVNRIAEARVQKEILKNEQATKYTLITPTFFVI